MQIINLHVDKENSRLEWMLGEKTISIMLKDIIIATFEPNEKCIYVETGRNFVVDSVFNFLTDGTELFSYHVLTGIVKWLNKGKVNSLIFNGLKQDRFYTTHKLIIALIEDDKGKEVRSFNNNGDEILYISEIVNVEPLYLSNFKNNPAVVCRSTPDQFGRTEWCYTIDFDKETLVKEGVAY